MDHPRARLVLIESNTTGSGRGFCAAARARGLRPLVLTRDPDRYPYLAEDGIDTRVTDTADLNGLIELCAGLAEGTPAGVTSSSEYYVATAAAVAAKLGLPAPDAEAVARCRDKGVQRRLLADAGVPVPEFRVVRGADEGLGAADAFGLPVVVKPVLGSGSVGVRMCTRTGELSAALHGLLARRHTEPGPLAADRVLVEEYLDGPEFSVETFDERVVGVTGKHLGAPPFFVETGHDFPAPVPEAERAALAATALDALRALGLGWGPAHTELRLTADGPRVVEVNPRLAGGMIPAAVLEATGVDLVDAAVARASGAHPDLQPSRDRGAAIRFLLAPGPGRITGVDGLADARRSPGARIVEPAVRVGRRVSISHSFRDRLGYAVAGGADAAQAAARAEDALRRLRIRVGDAGPPTMP